MRLGCLFPRSHSVGPQLPTGGPPHSVLCLWVPMTVTSHWLFRPTSWNVAAVTAPGHCTIPTDLLAPWPHLKWMQSECDILLLPAPWLGCEQSLLQPGAPRPWGPLPAPLSSWLCSQAWALFCPSSVCIISRFRLQALSSVPGRSLLCEPVPLITDASTM